ncbi:MAG TPA: hypothetical protein VF615_11135 [Longimicrobiaceae bacterium]|jgi:hypothetical protein
MYSTCIFCNSQLGANEAIEEFPVGRRLAFDAARGRLWAVCRACGRWNLSPLETRWEAVEACERSFRDTRVRVSTENVGLARLAEGTELVRIGSPLRPEFAAWRYGSRFAARARREQATRFAAGGIGIAAAAGAALFALPALLLGVPAALALAVLPWQAPPAEAGDAAQRALVNNRGEPLVSDRGEKICTALLHPQPRGGSRWWLEVETVWTEERYKVMGRKHKLTGGPALEAAAVILAGANAFGGSRREVQGAVERIERVGDPDRYLKEAEREARRTGRGHRDLRLMPREVRLAMEMAAHEDSERRAMEGELAELERRWRAAEEIAAIADRLTIPAEVESRLDRMKRRVSKA